MKLISNLNLVIKLPRTRYINQFYVKFRFYKEVMFTILTNVSLSIEQKEIGRFHQTVTFLENMSCY